MSVRKSGSGPRLEIVIDGTSRVGREMVVGLIKASVYVNVE